jgi:hypothetical protein
MAEYTGSALACFFNTVDISGQMRTISIQEAADEAEEIDVTHKGDAARVLLEGFAGAEKTTVEVELLDAEDDASAIMGFALNAKDTLFIYPEGKVAENTELTLYNARMNERTQELIYDDVVTISATFHAKNTITRGTYSA